ncbi:MFS transporter [Sphingomonas sp.]|jgi:MFS family permease|uniref:MFS transporter n=1 Tax=Sphingomonas sp. TaxID=28214 RepID=UPI002DED94C4|nr:MFS transporter [Sphingomonas sp.]HEV2568837.1 MFS transporter [Sphingomonas sp.]
MQTSMRLLGRRRFLPIFVTQFLGAFNDNLFKTAMVLFATYQVYSDPKVEMQFNALATGLFILPFFLLSALSGQLADTRDKARIIRLVKTAEIFIMIAGAIGLLLPSIPLMLGAVLAMGVHSTFFGPIKYAILPQHLEPEEVLGGTGLVEAGTYIAILAGTITAGFITQRPDIAAGMVLMVAILGWFAGRQVPPAPPVHEEHGIDWHIVRSSFRLVNATMHIPRLFLAICSISFFWTIGAVLVIEFPPLVKNVLTSNEQVASLFLAVFSVGVAIGSVAINRLLKGEVSARYSPISVIAMAGFILGVYAISKSWEGDTAGSLYNLAEFIEHPSAVAMLIALFGVAVTGGMFVVPLYAFLTTTVEKDQTARTVAANNIVNSGSMVAGSLLAFTLSAVGVSAVDQLLMVSAMCFISAWLAWKLHQACGHSPKTAL